jgi:hypothetical protein
MMHAGESTDRPLKISITEYLRADPRGGWDRLRLVPRAIWLLTMGAEVGGIDVRPATGNSENKSI